MVKNKNTVAIIPARGGSKRIPKKNIIEFFDKPLIAYTIEAAIGANCFDKVMVSTDCEEIADISVSYGAEVPFLREDKTDDFSTVSEATIYTLNRLQKEKGENYDTVFQLMANCPIRDSNNILEFGEYFSKNDLNFLISSFAFGWMNPWWAFKITKNNTYIRLFEDEAAQRSQDLDKLYCPTGAIWVAKTEELIKQGSFYGDGHRFFPLDWKSAIDIDDYEDLEMAKAVFILKNKMI